MPVAGGPVSAPLPRPRTRPARSSIIGVDDDGYETAPQYADVFLTSVVKKIADAVDESTTDR